MGNKNNVSSLEIVLTMENVIGRLELDETFIHNI